MLPADLRSAEGEALVALKEALADSPNGRWTMELRFEGLKLLPLALRLLAALKPAERPVRLVFPDAGAAALARRDAPGLAPQLGSLGDQLRRQEQDNDPKYANQGQTHESPLFEGRMIFKKSTRNTRARTPQPNAAAYVNG